MKSSGYALINSWQLFVQSTTPSLLAPPSHDLTQAGASEQFRQLARLLTPKAPSSLVPSLSGSRSESMTAGRPRFDMKKQRKVVRCRGGQSTRICSKPFRPARDREMAKQGLTYANIAKRRACEVDAAKDFFQDIGARVTASKR